MLCQLIAGIRCQTYDRTRSQCPLPLAGIWLLLLMPVQSIAASYYVDSVNGNDSNSGLSEGSALRSVSRLNSISLNPGDSVFFRKGQSFGGTLDISDDGSGGNPIRVGAWGSGPVPVLFGVLVSGDHIVIEDLVVDHQKSDSDAIRVRGGRYCVLRNLEVRNGTRDAIDADAADGLLIDNVEIHHFLNGTFGSEDDAHGVVVTNTVGVTIRNSDIHHVSGDSFQADPNRSPGNISNDIVIEDSVLWTGPLQDDFNAGWRAGDSPGENAVDTKVLTSGYENEIRMSLSLVNVTSYGFTAIPEISNRAAFNLKEKINAVVDRVTVYDSEIAFRIRGGRGNADTMIANAVIYDVDRAIRAEDGLENLRVYNSTFGNGISQQLHHAGGGGGTGSWDWRNNAFIGSKPPEAAHASNMVATSSDFVAAGQRNYQLSSTSSLNGAGVTLNAVTHDRNGQPRVVPYDSGAFEYPVTGAVVKPNPPTNLTVQ